MFPCKVLSLHWWFVGDCLFNGSNEIENITRGSKGMGTAGAYKKNEFEISSTMKIGGKQSFNHQDMKDTKGIMNYQQNVILEAQIEGEKNLDVCETVLNELQKEQDPFSVEDIVDTATNTNNLWCLYIASTMRIYTITRSN